MEYDNYIELVGQLERRISECVNMKKEFWNEMLEEQPQFDYIRKLGDKFRRTHSHIPLCHHQVLSIFENSIKERLLYYSYLDALDWSRTHVEEMNDFLEYAD